MLSVTGITPQVGFGKRILLEPLKKCTSHDLYYIAKDGTEIPVNSPKALKMLDEINKTFWQTIKIKKFKTKRR